MSTVVRESRAYDAVYDSTYIGPYNNSNAVMDSRVRSKQSSVETVSGQARYKYFKRPIMPRMNAIPPQILLAPTVNQDPLVPVEIEPEPLVKTVEVQTLYRESEAQTIPYSPEYYIPDGNEPEVLLLKDFSSEKGLPLGQKEIAMIEHARAKKNLESNMPPFTDECSLKLRKKLMEQQELREFKLREKEIDLKREERLNQLQLALAERDESNEFLASQRIEAIRQSKMEEREKVLAKIRNKRIKVLRRLAHQRNESDPVLSDSSKADIIDQYFDKTSHLYAPKRREGQEARSDPSKFEVKTRTSPLDSNVQIETFELTIPKSLLSVDAKNFNPAQASSILSKTAPALLSHGLSGGGRAAEDRTTSSTRRDIRNTKRDVEEMHQILQRKKLESTSMNTPSQGGSLLSRSLKMDPSPSEADPDPPTAFSSKKPTMMLSPGKQLLSSTGSTAGVWSGAGERERTGAGPVGGAGGLVATLLSKKPKGRPVTPNLTVNDRGESLEVDYEFSQAVILLQRLLRGRAVQNLMFEGKHRRRELITELRTADEEASKVAAKNAVEIEAEFRAHRDDLVKSTTVDAVAGGTAVNLLHLLATEKHRLDSFKHFEVLAQQAAEERRMLEAAEGGRRQREDLNYPRNKEKDKEASGGVRSPGNGKKR